MKKKDNYGIIKIFSELNKSGIEIWLSEKGWKEYEILLISSAATQSEEAKEDEKVG